MWRGAIAIVDDGICVIRGVSEIWVAVGLDVRVNCVMRIFTHVLLLTIRSIIASNFSICHVISPST